MHDLIECVMNVSEGRVPAKLDQIATALDSVRGVSLLSYPADFDHNRAVFTFVGNAETVFEAALAAFSCAIEAIDMNLHEGIHPRIGAVDVVPFVPLGPEVMDTCIDLANRFGEEVARKFEIPVYLYQEAARIPERRDLAFIRRGQFEGLRELIRSDPMRRPDFGPCQLHSTAGASAVGARRILIAYNVALDTEDVGIARQIASRIREKNGGLKGLKALGLLLQSRKRVQVSMNLLDFKTTPLGIVFDRVQKEAHELGVAIHSSEIIGHVPAEALPPNWMEALKIENPSLGLILEERIKQVRPQTGRIEGWA